MPKPRPPTSGPSTSGPATPGPPAPRDPVADLRRIAFLLERAHEATHRVRAFRRAADVVSELSQDEREQRNRAGTFAELPYIGEVTARTITESMNGEEPVYLRRLQATAGTSVAEAGEALRAALRGDLHTHTDWSDGGSPPAEMAATARELGHEYLAITDHSPRLTVARGLTAERLRRQLELIEQLRAQVAPMRVLTGIEVDILDDGSLDQDEDLLAELDIVVASVHSGLRAPSAAMTQRMVTAIANPLVDVLGHCTGRMVTGKRHRPPSDFDAEVVFAACERFDVAVEINSRPERLDPPKRLLRLAVEAGCRFAIDTDAHAPGQLDWQPYGCERASLSGVTPDSVVNTWPADRLLEWSRARPH